MISFHESPTSAKSQKHAQRVPRLYSYVVTFDGGFAPNPFWGYCTLACCKPKIRRTAQKWDWVVGLTPKSQGNNLVYAMCITEDPLTFDDYFNNEDFQNKKPTTMRHSPKRNCGDNIYEQRGDGRYKQLFSIHSGEPGSKKRDLSGKYVLASHDFYYFGVIPKKLPEYLRTLIVGRGHKYNFHRESSRLLNVSFGAREKVSTLFRMNSKISNKIASFNLAHALRVIWRASMYRYCV